MAKFSQVVSEVPRLSSLFAGLERQTLAEGPLDERSRALAAVAVALALRHPELGDAMAWAKQRGVTNEDIGHAAAIAAAWRATATGAPQEEFEFAAAAGAPPAQPEAPAGGCC